MSEKQELPKHCPECKSQVFYFRTITHTYICRKCGHTWPKKEAITTERE